MTRAEVLQAVETLSYAERVRFMIALGRRRDTESRAVVSELEHGGFYERLLALHASAGSRDVAHIGRALADPSRSIRQLALRLFPPDSDEAQMRAALVAAPAELRERLLRRVRTRAPAVVDAVLNTMRTDDPQYCRLLAIGSPALVKSRSAAFRRRAASSDWRVLARFHPAIALDLLHEWADTTTTADARLLEQVNALLPVLARTEPRRVLQLVETLRQWFDLSRINLSPLVSRLPREVTDLALAAEGPVQVELGGVARHLRTDELIALCKERPHLLSSGPADRTRFPAWFLKLAPEQRLALYTACRVQLCPPHPERPGCLPPQVVAVLPRPQREDEARRHVDDERLPLAERLRYVDALPWDEVVRRVEASLASSDEEVQARALSAMTSALRYHRDRLPDVLARLRVQQNRGRARREVREALLGLPVSVWQEDHLAQLKPLLWSAWPSKGDDAYKDNEQQIPADLAWLAKLMPQHVDWAAQRFNLLMHNLGEIPERRIVAPLPKETAQRLLQWLTNLLYVWSERGYPEGAAGTLQAFLTRRHRSALRAFVPLLEEIVLERCHPRWDDDAQAADRALRVLFALQPERRDTLIPALLEGDREWMRVPAITTYVVRQRTDLLTPFFDPPASQVNNGAAASGSAGGSEEQRVPVTLRRQWIAGTAMQQERLADALMQTIRRQRPPDEHVAQAIQLLALLPAISPARLLSLTQDPRAQVAAEAQRALRRIDAPQAQA
jgi:hypothetical protein